MAKKEFILQGFTAQTHGNAIRELFEVADVERVILSVAFVSESGVEQIEEKLKRHANKVTMLAGVRNEITSYQALVRLWESGIELFTVDTGSRNILFHPKLYLVRGKKRARFIVGSANLTLGGLNNNIESGLLLDFNLADPADAAVVKDVEAKLIALPKDYPSHVVKVTGIAALDKALSSGRIIDEMALLPPRPATAAGEGGATDVVKRIKLKVAPLHRPLRKAKAPAKEPRDVIPPVHAKKGKTIAQHAAATPGVEFELVWESKPLTERDLNVPSGKNTHATGSINLDKGLLPADVDHRHYFRDDVFPSLNWAQTAASKKVEEAFAKFQLVLKGISYGEFDLRIAHSTDSTSKSYKQNNAMTRLSWGPMRDKIARPDLIGRTLSLFRDKADPKRFVLDID